MKRIISTVLCLLLIFASAGCAKSITNSSESDTKAVMMATVAKIEDGSMTVTPVEGSMESDYSNSFSVPIINMPSSPEPQTGDTVEITYNGTVTVTNPENNSDVYSIEGKDIYSITVIR